MAKKRKTHRKSSRRGRRRRISGFGIEPDLMGVVGSIAGAIGAGYLKNLTGSMLTFQGKDYSGVAPLALGFFMPKFSTDPFFKGVGSGLVAAGGVSVARAVFPSLPIAGIDQIGMYSTPTIGMGSPRYLQGIDQIGMVNRDGTESFDY